MNEEHLSYLLYAHGYIDGNLKLVRLAVANAGRNYLNSQSDCKLDQQLLFSI